MKLDLGVRQLLPEWKRILSREYLKEDCVAGLTVACIALPFSLAIALASGVDPVVGLVTAIVASIVCGLFGGTPLGISGPAAVMTVLIASIVQQYGTPGLILIGLGCGLLQLLTGVLGLGKIIGFIPIPVIAGFTAGIGAIIFIGQLPRALGLPVPDPSHVFDVVNHLWDFIHVTQFGALSVALLTILITFILPRFFPRLPAPLIAVLIPSVLVDFFKLDVEMIGAIPSSLPWPTFPVFSGNTQGTPWVNLLGPTVVVFLLASLQTLLASRAVDRLSKAETHDSDLEMIGQGLGNVTVSLFGGIPVTGLIARSASNIQAGARTRRASLFHAFFLLLAVYFFSSLISKIPTAVLAGTLLSVSLRMLHPRELIELWKASHAQALIYLITFFVIVCVDLTVGIQAGVIAAVVIALIRLEKSTTSVELSHSAGPSQVSIDGALTFLSTSKLDAIRTQLRKTDCSQGLLIDLSRVNSMDVTGVSQLAEMTEELERSGILFAIKGLSPSNRDLLLSSSQSRNLVRHLASSEDDVFRLLGKEGGYTGLDRLFYGVGKFQRELKEGYQALFHKLAEGQSPHTLLITCSDSRINPNLITSTEPGEIFIVRNVGNIIPRFGEDSTPAEGAAVEFALGVLGVKEVIVCGHSGCGAMSALLSGHIFTEESRKKLPSVAKWLEYARSIRNQLPEGATADQVAELNALMQLENLKTYPLIQQKLASGEVRLHAWYYNIRDSQLEEWDESQNIFVKIGTKSEIKSMEHRMEAGVQFQALYVAKEKEKKGK